MLIITNSRSKIFLQRRIPDKNTFLLEEQSVIIKQGKVPFMIVLKHKAGMLGHLSSFQFCPFLCALLHLEIH